MRSRLAIAVSMWAAAVSMPALAGPELILNGDFETPTVSGISCFQNNVSNGWTSFGPGANLGSCFVASGATSLGLTWPTAHTGSQLMLINNQEFVGTKIAQNVQLAAGTPYQLTFSMAGVSGDATTPAVSFSIAGVGSQSFSTAASTVWSDKVWNFTPATTGSLILSITATAGYVNIDSLSLQSPVPEVKSSMLMTLGLVLGSGLFLLGRRRPGPPRA